MRNYKVTAQADCWCKGKYDIDAILNAPAICEGWDIDSTEIIEKDEPESLYLVSFHISTIVTAESDDEAWENSPDVGPDWDINDAYVEECY